MDFIRFQCVQCVEGCFNVTFISFPASFALLVVICFQKSWEIVGGGTSVAVINLPPPDSRVKKWPECKNVRKKRAPGVPGITQRLSTIKCYYFHSIILHLLLEMALQTSKKSGFRAQSPFVADFQDIEAGTEENQSLCKIKKNSRHVFIGIEIKSIEFSSFREINHQNQCSMENTVAENA